MSKVILVRAKHPSGVDCFLAESKEDEKATKGLNVLVCTLVGKKATITALQMRSIHKYFSLLAAALNARGWDMIATMARLSSKGRIPWSASAVKERLFRPIMFDTYQKKSTTELETTEVSGTYEALNLVTAEQLGVSIPFPDEYSKLINEQYPEYAEEVAANGQ